MAIERYIPTIGNSSWDIKELSKEERNKIKERLIVGITHSEEEYQAAISYIHNKYNDLMDNNKEAGNLQWLYSPARNKAEAIDVISDKIFDMYAFVYYDPERDFEPVAFAGSYIKKAEPVRYMDSNEIIPGQEIDESGFIRIGFGYVLFVDPDYRRMGLADGLWVSESQLYRDSGIRFQREIQNSHSVEVTKAMFDDPSKCIITSPGRLKVNGDYCQIRCLLDYTDKSLIRSFDELPENLKNFRNPFDWTFLKRENLTIDELTKPWKK